MIVIGPFEPLNFHAAVGRHYFTYYNGGLSLAHIYRCAKRRPRERELASCVKPVVGFM